MTTMRFHEEGVKLRTREMELLYQLELPMTHYMLALRAARLKNIEGVERWSEGIAKDLKRKKVIPEDIAGLPPPAAARVEEMPLPSLINRGKCLKRELVLAGFCIYLLVFSIGSRCPSLKLSSSHFTVITCAPCMCIPWQLYVTSFLCNGTIMCVVLSVG